MRFALESPGIVAHFGIVNAGQALKHIHLVDMRATPCPVPRMDEQREIAACLRSIVERSESERATLIELQELKSALMSVLLTGEVRVTPDVGV
jgi:type I restriction enzyme S subunit